MFGFLFDIVNCLLIQIIQSKASYCEKSETSNTIALLELVTKTLTFSVLIIFFHGVQFFWDFGGFS